MSRKRAYCISGERPSLQRERERDISKDKASNIILKRGIVTIIYLVNGLGSGERERECLCPGKGFITIGLYLGMGRVIWERTYLLEES